MQLFIEQKIGTFKRRYYIKDEAGFDVYHVDSEWITSTLHLHISDLQGKRLLTIRRKSSFMTPGCDFIVDNKKIARMEKEGAFNIPQFTIKELNWKIKGDITGHFYLITKDDKEIGSISKAIVHYADSYTLDIPGGNDKLYMIGAVLALDCILFEGQKSSRFLFG